jgi:hypothetical protein
MTDYGKRGKPKAGFPLFPQPLEIAKSAIPTFPQPGDDREEKWKSKTRIPTFPSRFPFPYKTQKGGFP